MRTHTKPLLVLSLLAGAACNLGPIEQDPSGSRSSPLGSTSPSSCQGLDEQSCQARPDCVAQYACADICLLNPDGTCAPCTPSFAGCSDANPMPPPPPPTSRCDGLGEQQCNAASGCRGEYLTACAECAPGTPCPPSPPCTSTFSACVEDVAICAGGDTEPGSPPPSP